MWNIGIIGGERVGGRPARVERRGHRLQVDGEVARDHALGERRGARGVEVGERVAVGDLRGGGVRVLGLAVGQRDPQPVGGLGGVLRAKTGEHDHFDHTGGLAQGVAHRLDELRLDGEALGPRVPEHVGHLVGTPTQVDRHADEPELRAGVVDGEELGAVARGQAERVAALPPRVGEAVRDAVDPVVELGVGEAAAAVDDRDLVGPGRGAAGERIADVDAVDEIGHQ